VIYLGIGFLIRLALTTLNSTMPFYASYVLGLGTTGASWLLGVALGAALLAMRPWAWLLARWGARRTALIAELLVAAAVLPFLFLRDWPSALAAAALAGINLAGLQVTPDVLLAEVVDADHVYTGQRHEGIYFGVGNFVNRLPNVLQAAGIGEMLTLAGFSAGLTTQPPAVTVGLRLLIGGVPALALGLAALLTWLYPLHGARLAQIKAQVAVLRAAAEGLEGGN
jgi:GPH family glycoside/pentoside/hexuronide:cation symporter